MKRGLSFISGAAFFLAVTGAPLAQKVIVTEKRAPTKIEDPPKTTTVDPQIAIQFANDYFNSFQVMTADFVQIGADGRRSEGKLYLSKPGRMRFEYAQPATLEIIADGVTVAVRDRKLQTQELYFINETPLKFLLKSKVDLKKDVKIINVFSDEKSTTIAVEDRDTFGGVSKIKLNFVTKIFNLRQWEVTDPQGYQTLITLHNIDLKAIPDGNLFRIPSNNIFPFQNWFYTQAGASIVSTSGWLKVLEYPFWSSVFRGPGPFRFEERNGPTAGTAKLSVIKSDESTAMT